MPKKELSLLRVLPGFRDIHRYPSMILGVEVGPAVIAGNFTGVLVAWQRKSDLEASGNALRARHRYEEGMEVGAVPALGIARVQGIAMSPAGPALVVTHVGQHILVKHASFLIFPSLHIL